MKRLIVFFLAGCILAACHKDPPSSSIKLQGPSYFWSRYMGTYDVYDTINHTQWVMKISHIGAHSDYNGGNEDSVLIENFANKFTIRDTWDPVYDQSLNAPCFYVKIYHPIIDYLGHSWHLGSEADTTSTRENVLINDTIVMYFLQSNIAYYIQEGQPYYSCNCRHIAVKRH